MSRPSRFAVSMVLCRRDLVRFVRQPARLAAAVGTPALLWIFLASGIGESFRPSSLETSYGAFLVPGMLTLVAVFAAVFSAISIIEDRDAGWLQAVITSPAPRSSIAMGRTLGGATVAWFQAALLVPLALVSGLGRSVEAVLLVLAALYVTSFAMTAMGLALAWRCPTSAAFHAIMNLVFMPMWLLSGAFFPPDAAHGWLGWLIRINPLHWCTESIRTALDGTIAAGPFAGAIAFAALTFVGAVIQIERRAS